MKEKRKESIIMPAKKKHPVRLEELTPDEKIKYEIAEELGLLEKVQKGGWKSLSSRETGKIGGILSTRRKAQAKNERPEQA